LRSSSIGGQGKTRIRDLHSVRGSGGRNRIHWTLRHWKPLYAAWGVRSNGIARDFVYMHVNPP
ncbi:MAG TPA: hypothetical protein VIG47_10195, partial [Gemmatimonadaceae bacterium]